MKEASSRTSHFPEPVAKGLTLLKAELQEREVTDGGTRIDPVDFSRYDSA
jgi:hypothetical protein